MSYQTLMLAKVSYKTVDTNNYYYNSLDIILTIDDLNAVITALWDARAKWKDIGSCIGVDAGTLATMKGSDNVCLRDTLSHWLRGVYRPGEQNSKPRTWHTLIEALRTKIVNEAAMANKLEREVSRR